METLQPPPPLALVKDDDPQFLQAANKKLPKKSRLSRLFSLPDLRSRHQALDTEDNRAPPLEFHVSGVDATPINLDNSALLAQDIHNDRYEWAVLYENQRGLTFFSIPYYSSLSLLPTDPSPFTIPEASLKRSKQPPLSLENYPLPDGNWKWVSRCWMIDMRSDSGEVQHDGFEYNWLFRRHNWRAQIGSFNAGGWVRRRRWIRLMVRPAKPRKEDLEVNGSPTTSPNPNLTPSTRPSYRLSAISTFSPSMSTNLTGSSSRWSQIEPDEVWQGELESDWQRCLFLLKHIDRDGRKLELWKLWLGFYHPEHKDDFQEKDKGKQRQKQWTEDRDLLPLPSELAPAEIISAETVAIAPKEHVVSVLRVHGQDMLHLFVFPESRVQFIKLLGQAGILSELNAGLSVDFWSYTVGLREILGPSNPELPISSRPFV
ncbi:hypothetical protein CPB84DRAFT_1813266 [Gymnopilus junonius]|uniref:TECPR1-like DysF domain-containing protein n=1 Tax=Gymnopilus junonius TaxID=109634 RepID=A0A9P5NYJ1_GYMJU|nr:hypothetical protein CPB84DRAFT_1813266 [Gymnopilus junonius]